MCVGGGEVTVFSIPPVAHSAVHTAIYQVWMEGKHASSRLTVCKQAGCLQPEQNRSRHYNQLVQKAKHSKWNEYRQSTCNNKAQLQLLHHYIQTQPLIFQPWCSCKITRTDVSCNWSNQNTHNQNTEIKRRLIRIVHNIFLILKLCPPNGYTEALVTYKTEGTMHLFGTETTLWVNKGNIVLQQ